MKNVLILGGGFAGLEAAIYLRKADFHITLVSDRNYFYIYPTSIWIPTGRTTFEKVCIDLKALQAVHGFDLIVDAVTDIRAYERKVTLASGRICDGYDYLVIAMGAGKMKPDGIEHTLSICGDPEQAVTLKSRLDAMIALGHGKIAMGFGGNPKDSSAMRGGPAFELLFNVHHTLKSLGVREQFELIFFAPMEQPGARMGEKALKTLELFFNRMNISRRFGKKIKNFTPEGVTFEDDTTLEADMVMFIPAGDGHSVIKASDLPKNEAGFIIIDDNCCVRDETLEGTVFAIGDCAAIEGPAWRAKQGHIAEVMARNVAYNIAMHAKEDFRRKGYRSHLNILCVMDSGDGAAFVYRDDKRAFLLPLPVIGHWLKKGWGWYCRNSKLGKIPRMPGL